MPKNCNLELGLSQPPLPRQSAPHQPLTIFYDSQISVCDVTEFQARAIIKEASKEMGQDRCKWRGFDGPISPSSPLQCQVSSPGSGSGMSMKKSLERFLQRRKDRQMSNH